MLKACRADCLLQRLPQHVKEPLGRRRRWAARTALTPQHKGSSREGGCMKNVSGAAGRRRFSMWGLKRLLFGGISRSAARIRPWLNSCAITTRHSLPYNINKHIAGVWGGSRAWIDRVEWAFIWIRRTEQNTNQTRRVETQTRGEEAEVKWNSSLKQKGKASVWLFRAARLMTKLRPMNKFWKNGSRSMSKTSR